MPNVSYARRRTMEQHPNSQNTHLTKELNSQTEYFAVEQTQCLYSVAPTNILGNSIVTLLIPLLLWPVTAHATLLTWLLCQLIVILLRIILVYTYRQKPSADIDTMLWKRRYIISTAIAGAFWGLGGFFLFPESSLAHQFLLTLMLAGNVAAASSSCAVEMYAYMYFSLPIFLALFARLMSQGTMLHFALTGMLLILLFFLLINIYRRNRTIRESLTLRFENLDLRASLAAEKKRIEALDERLNQEITERQSTKDALIAERNQLRILVDNLPDYIFVKDTKSRFLLVNKSSLFGAGLNEMSDIVGKTDFDLFPSELAEKYYQNDQKVIRSGQAVINDEEQSVNLTTGVHEWRLTTKIPFRNSHGDIAGIIGITRDITERKLREDSFRQHNRELILLNHMSDLLQTCDVEEKTYGIVKSICAQLFASDAGALYVLNNDRTRFELMTSWGNLPGVVRSLNAGNCSVMTRDKNYCIAGSTSDPVCPHVRSSSQENGYICAPISAPEEIMGLLYIRLGHYDSSEEQQETIEAKRLVATRIVRHYALFLSNLRLRETLRMEAIRDPLTQLYNRRYMEEFLDREIRHAKRQKSSIGIILFDIDHFKGVNDNYGHEAGDVILRKISSFIRSHIRAEDMPCRYGGEEFLLIFPDMSIAFLQERAEELRAGIAALETIYQELTLTVTISLGIATIPNHGKEISEVIHAADTALYQAKNGGRNQVVTAPML